jgi:double-GTPase-like protein
MKFYVSQPAYKIYAFDRGWRIMRHVTIHLFQRTHISALKWFQKARDLVNTAHYKEWYVKYALYTVVGGLVLGGIAQYASAMLITALFIAIHAIILSVWAALSTLLMGLLATFTFTYSRYYGIFFRCPDCHKEMPLPVFICPTCQTEHTRLWPSLYGVLSHRCKTCNTTRLPTIGPLGRHKLARICPHCRRPLNIGIGGGTNLHIPIVGGASTGKTNYIVMATREFKHIYEEIHHYSITFTDPIHQQNFEANAQRLASGRELVKTPEIVPQAYNLAIKAPRRWKVPTIVYVYDAAGEAFNTSENTDSQVYYKYIDAIVFVIDPCAIPAYYKVHYGEIELLRQSLRPSELDVMQAYERMTQMFEASIGLQKGRRYSHPIAVVITKVDALELENEIGTPAAQALLQRDSSITSEEDAMSTVVRDSLCNYGLDHFVRELELQFANVKYFSCSALGRLPAQEDTSGFIPIRVVDPLLWLLAQTRAIKVVHKARRPTSRLPETVRQVVPERIRPTTPRTRRQMANPATSPAPETDQQTVFEAILQATPPTMQQMSRSTLPLPETIYQTTSEAVPETTPLAMEQIMPQTAAEEEEW